MYLYFQIPPYQQKIVHLLGGIASGLIACIITFSLSYSGYQQIHKYSQMGVEEILPDKRNIDYYREIIKEAKNTCQVMGRSCSRFIGDFADENSKSHALIDALNKNSKLKVQFLVPSKDHMADYSERNFQSAQKALQALVSRYGSRVEMRRFDFPATHSLVRVDGNLIVGSVFPEVESKNSSAVHLRIESAYADNYIEYFEEVWKKSKP